jgi:hypothetical protein
MRRFPLTRLFVFSLLAVFVLSAGPVIAQEEESDNPCGEEMRAKYVSDVEAGLSEDELEEIYGHCRDYAEPSECPVESSKAKAGGTSSPFQQITNFNIGFERMTGCGYHPQAEMVACNVEIRLPFGFGGFGSAPTGSFEHVLFCFDCDRNGTFEFTTAGNVHVTDLAPGQANLAPYYMLAYATTFHAPAGCTNNNGGGSNVTAILSWFSPPANCSSRPFWGNRIDFTARRDP